MVWMKYKLKDIYDLQMGKTPSRNNSEYWNTEENKWISIADLTKTGKYISETKEYLSKSAVLESGIRVIPADTVVMSFKLSIGKTAITAENMYSNEAIMAFHDKHVVDILPEYIYYMFTYKNWDEGSNKAVMGKTLNKAILSEVEIEICPIEKQQAIVDVLDKMMLVLEDKERELSLLDDLIKARFVEMFGGYERFTTVGNYIAELRGGKSLAGTEPCKNKVLKTGAATFGWFDPEQYKYLPQDYEPLPEHRVKTGDVMVSRMNTPELVGACSYVFEAPEDMYYPDRLWKVIPKNQANPIFIWQLLWDPEIRRQIKEKSGGTSGTMHNISKQKLLEIKCIDVPVNEQNNFSDFVVKVNKSKVAVQKSLEKTQLLFDSLMQEYFG